ncbi:hypothetical protein BDV93DRAFT_236649 [Ceratobasidium sp. AG-I]|nr:hypothetical protein BDV93DRAFT_236649 [Ceratobasidium sp. AG-I]
MINHSPNLASLAISFLHGSDKLQPNQFFQSLNRDFPTLRKLEILGAYEINWGAVFAQTSPLYRFFEHHPGLRIINFDQDLSDQACVVSAASPMFERLFPSVLEFSGMSSLCMQVVSSPKLSQQVEKLKMIDILNRPNAQPPPDLNALSRAVSSLPRLQHFEYIMLDHSALKKPLDADSLSNFLAACPSLVFLKIPYLSNQLRDLLDPLIHAQNLSVLHFLFEFSYDAQHAPFLREFVHPVSTVCPKLSRLESSSVIEGYDSLNIARLPDGSIQLVSDDPLTL